MTAGAAAALHQARAPVASDPEEMTLMTLAQPQRRHHVVIIGSGFGGLFAARALRKAPVDVTLVARTSHHLFQPLLYQVATGILSAGEVAPATREILKRQRNARVILGDVKKIDLDGPHRHLVRPRDRDRHALRQPHRRRRLRAVLLRQRPLRRVRAGHEEHRRRPRAARPDLRRLRARRDRAGPGERATA